MNPNEHDPEWHHPSCMKAVLNGHNPKCTLSNGHDPKWTQSPMNKILDGQDAVWTRS